MYNTIFQSVGLALEKIDTKTVTLFNQPKAWIETHGLNIALIIIGAWVFRRVVVAVVIGLINRAVSTHPFASNTDRKKRIDTLDSLISGISKLLIWIVSTVMIVDELGINTAPLLASAGVVGVAIGIGAQSLIKDFTNGLFIIVENQYRVGDFVQFDRVSGVVQAITIRTTILKDFDGNVHHVPNSSITIATNMTFDTSGINEEITVNIDTDIDKLERIINKIGESLANDEEIGKRIKKAPYFAQVVRFGDRGIVVKVIGETTAGSHWRVKTELLKRLRTAFMENGIDIPMPPRTESLVKAPTKKKKQES